MTRLTLRYAYNDRFDPARDDAEEAGRVTVAVEGGAFSGQGTFDASPRSLQIFGEGLAAFPIARDQPREALWGYAGRMARVTVRAVNVTGTLLVSVEIEDAVAVPADAPVVAGVRAAFVTDYPQVEAFRRSLAALIDRRAGQAVLRGH